MSIRRNRTAFEDHYVQIPNAWLRDKRLSLKARGILAQLMTHREGWSITLNSLSRDNEVGIDAIRSGVNELIQVGYLIRGERERDDKGYLGDYEYSLWTQQTIPGSGEPTSGEPTSGNPTTKKTISQEDHHQETPPTPSADDDAFEALWTAWPRKDSKQPAKKRWQRLSSKKRAEITPLLVAHANAYRQHTPPQYIPYLTTWLRDEGWQNPLAVSRDRGANKPEPKPAQGIVIPAGHVPVRDEMTGQIIGSRPA